MLSETGPAPYTRIPPAELRPAPMPGEQTREICQEPARIECRRNRSAHRRRCALHSIKGGHDGPADAGAGRLRPGQPARRETRGGTGRPDGVGGPRRCRPTCARGRRLGARGQPAVLAIPRSRIAGGTAYSGQGRRHPLHRHRRKCPAVAGQPGVPGHPGGPRGRRADRGSRDMAHPYAIAEGGEKADWTSQDDSVPMAPGSDEGIELAGPVGSADQAGPPRLRLPDVRAGAADRRGRIARRPPPPHRRTVVAVQCRGRDKPARVEPRAVVGQADRRRRARAIG